MAELTPSSLQQITKELLTARQAAPSENLEQLLTAYAIQSGAWASPEAARTAVRSATETMAAIEAAHRSLTDRRAAGGTRDQWIAEQIGELAQLPGKTRSS